MLQEKKSCDKKKNILSLYQEEFPWHQKSFLWEYGSPDQSRIRTETSRNEAHEGVKMIKRR